MSLVVSVPMPCRETVVTTIMSRRALRRTVWATAIVVALSALVVVVVAAFPLGLLRPVASRALSAALGRPATVGGLERLDTFSLTPVIRLVDVRIGQPAWVGDGDMARVASVRVRFAVAPLLRGRFVPIEVDVAGMHLALVRDATGRSNWSDAPRDGGTAPRRATIPQLRHLAIADSGLTLRDDKRHVVFDATVAADPAHGLAVTGAGTQRGRPLTVRATGGRLDVVDPAASYPFRAEIVSPLVVLTATGTMDHVLDTGHFTAAVAAHGHDLIDLDDIIQAGVPATQAFAMTARVRHDDRDWVVTRLAGTIGRSDLAGRLTARRRDGRSILDGAFTAKVFDFDDLASDEQLARGKAEEARIGKRIVPATAIHFEKLGRTDGVIRFSAAKLLSRHPSPFVGLDATLTMDHRRLTVRPVTARLTHGTLAGEIVVDHRTGEPKLSVALDLVGGRLEDLFAIDPARAMVPVDGRIRLRGVGDTVRAALGRGDGSLDVFGRGGGMDGKVATLAAGDVVRGLGLAIGGGSELALVRCVDARFVAHHGVLTARDLILDTAVMRAGGEGTVTLPDETLAMTLQGRSKHPDIVQSTVPIHIGGTLAKATFDVVPVDRSPPKKSLLGRIGEVVKSLKTRGDAGRATAAPDAPCAALAAAALGADWGRRHPAGR